MENEMMIFENPEFGKIRTVAIDGEPWLVGKDMAVVLGYSNSRDALAKHIDEEDKATVAIHDGSQNRNMTIINESGLYSLILSSKLPNTKKFKRWVTSEVLPSIRKHGLYATENTMEAMLADPDTAIRLLQEIKDERKRRKALEAQIELDRPKVEFANAVHETKSNITVEKFAKLLYDETGLRIGRNKMFKLLRANGYLNEKNIPYQRYIDSEYFTTCEVMKCGKPYIVTLITGKGQLKLFKELVGKEK